MKFSLEIIGDKVAFEYEVGTSKAKAETPFSANWLMAFSRILQLAHDAWGSTNQERLEELKR